MKPMNRTDAVVEQAQTDGLGGQNLHWLHRGGTLDELMQSRPETGAVPSPAVDEIVARVEAVSICSSDIKVIQLGDSHPLYSAASPTGEGSILGHEMCLRVHAVGSAMADRFHAGQRLGLQPAMRINGRRQTIGMDLPGGFAQYLRLDGRALNSATPNVFNVPESLTAAEVALLEPYGCIERAWRPNARQTFDPTGRALIVTGPGGNAFSASRRLFWATVNCVGAAPPWVQASQRINVATTIAELGDASFDDIIALGDLDPDTLTDLAARLAPGGMLLQARQRPANGPSRIDPARIHYDALAFIGTVAPDILQALRPERQRFDVRPGGIALVLGAGGAMGRMHVHRLLQLAQGPATVVATSRKGQRLENLRKDFRLIAKTMGRQLLEVEDAALEDLYDQIAPQGFDDVTVIAPSAAAVTRGAAMLAPDGLLSVFAGMPYGGSVPFDLSRIATSGARLTGSTGCNVSDMQEALRRVLAGELSLLTNVKAVAGLNALPQALRAVTEGEVSGKIVIYPQAPDLPLTTLLAGWSKDDEAQIIR